MIWWKLFLPWLKVFHFVCIFILWCSSFFSFYRKEHRKGVKYSSFTSLSGLTRVFRVTLLLFLLFEEKFAWVTITTEKIPWSFTAGIYFFSNDMNLTFFLNDLHVTAQLFLYLSNGQWFLSRLYEAHNLTREWSTTMTWSWVFRFSVAWKCGQNLAFSTASIVLISTPLWLIIWSAF